MLSGTGKYIMKMRLNSKQLENRGKPPIASLDVVETADFLFTPFSLLGHDGDSGALLLASQKSDRKVRYVVKHECTDCACKEFVYTKLAQAMGYTMPGAVLFQISPTEKREYFKTEYVIGIRYLELEIMAPSYAEIREKAVNWNEFFSFLGMYAMFGEMDSFETPLAKDGKIYRLDTVDAFPISELLISTAGVNIDMQGVNPHAVCKEQLLSSDFSKALPQSDCDFTYKSSLEIDKSGISYFLDSAVNKSMI